ncbi:hypothetical protein LCGC14_0393570 [marine sediment metagenome]|uniref:Sensor protein n=3 Tax=root TaxID=1 RepID=A0A7V1BM43_9GAMM|nr:heavy metal sensor histidine kinase [Marinobacter antarcticus]HDZ55310.1 heavy metal sensor histidine kinase [Halopseudomonas xinjiangensis]HEA51698.1 heavy metal sensor histidine kinase [Marinobacter antarcticus]
MIKPLSLSLRIGLSVSILGSALILLIFSQSWLTLRSQLEIIAESKLEQKLRQIEHSITESKPSSASSLRSHVLVDLITGHPDLTLAACNAGPPQDLLFTIGTISSQVITDSLCLENLNFHEKRFSDLGINAMMISSTLLIASSDESLKLIIISNRSDDEELLNAYRNSTMVAIPLFLMIIGFGAWWIAQRGLAPLNNFRNLASVITTYDLNRRVPSSGLPVELKELADNINVMLGRLENGVQHLSDFSDDLAHELRSPITNLMGKAQVALSRDRTSLQYKETLESCVEELGRISRIVSDMLYLAQTLQSETANLSDRIHLSQEAKRVVNLFSIMAEDKNIMLTVQGDGVIVGDRLMVQRAISNLLSNAIRHASHHSNIPILIERQGQSIVLSVTNDGPGIPEEHTEAIFKRFYRVDSGRSRDEGGTGLGLSIVRSTMQIHQGSVTVQTDPAGPTTFQLWFRSSSTEQNNQP